MSAGLKNPDLRTSTYDVSKHASWTKEWLALGLPKEEKRTSCGDDGRTDNAALVQMSLPMAEREVSLVEQLTKGSGGGIVVCIAEILLVVLLVEIVKQHLHNFLLLAEVTLLKD